ncbi:hypothetical protein HFX_6417 (plasmid) [Haloferax mediterranei ATCC 33500]|uniref:Uncharacterized protein n=1 Tax=Haloferax mediterranei (strain ATCC 33500 / DSM 1411 / JCM 8866 / NBRC 14739 / NCIMB 2177 / R-4) TaxID=523841 RepID=I3RBC6_HALMT|nr:hypothetical protein HFX_6417 [Haloferax mediterranei ATCC 33500]
MKVYKFSIICTRIGVGVWIVCWDKTEQSSTERCLMSGHPGENVDAVHADDNQEHTDNTSHIYRFVENHNSDSSHADDAQCGPRPVHDTDWKFFQRQRYEIECRPVADDDAETRKWLREPLGEFEGRRSE